MFKILPVSVIALFAVAACGPDATPTTTTPGGGGQVTEHEAGGVEDLFPVAEGNSWTYEIVEAQVAEDGQTRRRTYETTLKVKSARTTDAGIEAVFETLGAEGAVANELIFLIGGDGLSQKALRGPDGQTAEYSPAIPMVYWPVESGKEHKWQGTGYRPGVGGVGPMEMTLTERGPVEVDTGAGRMRAFRVDTFREFRFNNKTYQSRQSLYFVPQIGLVRVLESVSDGASALQHEMKLLSHTVQ